ncbi:MAG TPA: exodeoxyribonuclease V subunit alpha [Propionibacteriaceae bacterium]|nr:exodeoxyribonuclease V subunit alpha [Propionibacteriaceae bacterium]
MSTSAGLGAAVSPVHGVRGLLAEFNAAGVLGFADVHTAEAIGRIGQESNEQVRLALALAVRALRNGSVCIDLTGVRSSVSSVGWDEELETPGDLAELPWPDAAEWPAICAASPLVADGPAEPAGRPLRLAHGLLYLERYWQQEEQVRQQLQSRFAAPPPAVDQDRLGASLTRLFTGSGLTSGEVDRQRLAAAVSALSWVTVLAGGPGTGKTTTVARVLALLSDQPGPPPRIGLAAPTGKAAARLGEAIRSASAQLGAEDQQRLGDLTASTLHRLLGWRPDSRSRFVHDAANQLPHDIVVVDEMSMVSLTLMTRLLEAVRPTARLILVGDPDQLSSVEAGAVLADIARAPGPPDQRLGRQLVQLELAPAAEPAPVHGVVQLSHTWRYGGAIDDLARAIRASDPEQALRVLRSSSADVQFTEIDLEADADLSVAAEVSGLADAVRHTGQQTLAAARSGDVLGALTALDTHRLLCAHRRGPYGVGRWSREAEHWLAEAIPGYAEDGEWYVGRPLLVTANDYEMGLYNGDTGVIVDTPDGVRAAFGRGATPALYAPVRLDAIQTLQAMTVHRAQGSQFERVSFLAPPPDSPLLTRELLYTAVTRATRHVQVIGAEAAIRRAILRPANRASGLRNRLGAPPPATP